MNYDVFNGDADGICALLQLRLAEPRDAQLVTGIKRDINLLSQVKPESGDKITVLDISMAKNSADLDRVLATGATVFYADHHQPGVIPKHPKLNARIDQNPNICTSLIVDQYLNGRFKAWAVVAAFGDNMIVSAQRAAGQMDLSSLQIDQLELLGTCLNYNGYGASIEDLHFPPDELYRSLSAYQTPFEFITTPGSQYNQLVDGYRSDMSHVDDLVPEVCMAEIAVYLLPDETWSRRVSGVFGNDLANQYPERAHAVVSVNAKGGYLISVRAPLKNRVGADQLCSSFATGGGRAGAAGINHLPIDQLPQFIDQFKQQYHG